MTPSKAGRGYDAHTSRLIRDREAEHTAWMREQDEDDAPCDDCAAMPGEEHRQDCGQQRLDVRARIAEIEEQTGMTSEQFIQLATDRQLKDPLWCEWAALLGCGDLMEPRP